MDSTIKQQFSSEYTDFPLVSVGLPVYNGMPYLTFSLSSLVAQDYPNLEIIVCDNCSTDETFNVCQEFSQRSLKIKYYKNSENIGAERNFEKVLQLSKGKYFMWAAHDDIWASSYITKCVEVLERYPSVVIACTDVAFINDAGQSLEQLNQSPHIRNLHTFGLDIIQSIHELISRSGWYSIYGLIRYDVVLSLIPYLKSKDYGSDVICGLRLILLGDYYRVDERLFFYRIHNDQASGKEIQKALSNSKKPYTSLFQNLLKCVLQENFSNSIKNQIKLDFIQTLAYQNESILSNLSLENSFVLNNYLTLNQSLDQFIKAVIVDPVLSSVEMTTSNISLDDKVVSPQKKAVIAYPFQLSLDSYKKSDKRCILLIQTLQSLGYEVTLFSQGDPKTYNDLAHNLGIKLSLFIEDEIFNEEQKDDSTQNRSVLKLSGIKESFDKLCESTNPSIILVISIAWSDLLVSTRSCCTSILDVFDLSLLLNQDDNRFSAEETDFDMYSIHSNLFLQSLNRYNLILTIDIESQEFIRAQRCDTVPIVIPYTYSSALTDYSKSPVYILESTETGKQDYLYFIDHVLPYILESDPDFNIRVFGDMNDLIKPQKGVLAFTLDQKILIDAKFVIFPHFNERFQHSEILEFMSLGLPIVTLQDNNSLIQTNVNGYVASHEQEFAECIINLYRDRKLCESLGSSGRQIVSLKYDHNIARYTFKLIEQDFHSTKAQPDVSNHFLVVVDAVFFQLFSTGIARVWRSLLEEWVKDGFCQHILVLDRDQTAPRIPGVCYYSAPPYDYENTEEDRKILQQICDEVEAKVFISTYYTTPVSTSTVILIYDMIPEVLGGDLSQAMWREKHAGIKHASAYIAISNNTANDLVKYFPDIQTGEVSIAYCGVDSNLIPARNEELLQFKAKYGITRPYYLLVGAGSGTPNTYKNTHLFFQAFSKLPIRHAFDIVCTGGGAFAPELREYTDGSSVHMLSLDDFELRLAYSGAVALVYPSKYEGFGMPIIEAMACGCPVITCPNASIPEVAGDAAIYIVDNDINALADALCEVLKPDLRALMIAEGLVRAKQFSWSEMAASVKSTLINTTLRFLNLRAINWLICPNWSCDELVLSQELTNIIRMISNRQDTHETTLLFLIENFSEEEANLLIAGIVMQLCLNEEVNLDNGLEITFLPSLLPIQYDIFIQKIAGRIELVNSHLELPPYHPLSLLSVFNLNNLPYIK